MIGADCKFEWKMPARLADVLHVKSEFTKPIPSRPPANRVNLVLRSRTVNQHGEVVLKLTATLILVHRPA